MIRKQLQKFAPSNVSHIAPTGMLHPSDMPPIFTTMALAPLHTRASRMSIDMKKNGYIAKHNSVMIAHDSHVLPRPLALGFVIVKNPHVAITTVQTKESTKVAITNTLFAVALIEASEPQNGTDWRSLLPLPFLLGLGFLYWILVFSRYQQPTCIGHGHRLGHEGRTRAPPLTRVRAVPVQYAHGN